jgi:hypothetical protein
MTTTYRGPFDAAAVKRFIDAHPIPLKVSVLTESGWPLLCSLWVMEEDGKLLLATKRSAKVVECLSRDPRCAFELSVEQPPYSGIRGRALASIDDTRGKEVLDQVLLRYLGSLEVPLAKQLRADSDEEVAIVLDLQMVYSWDYTKRMESSLQ